MKFKTIIILIVAGCILLTASGCATIIKGSDQEIGISSTPEKAELRVLDRNNMEIFSSKTPASVTLDRGDGFFQKARYTVEITKPGYETKSIQLTGKLNGGWYLAGNLIFGGWIGWLIVDPLSGAMWKLEPDIVNVRLDQEETAFLRSGGEGIHVVLLEEIGEDSLKRLNAERIN